MAPSDGPQRSPASRLEGVVQSAILLTKKARKARKNLLSDNYYANRLVELRAEATNIFRDLSAHSAGDATAMAEMIQTVFSPNTVSTKRLAASRDLIYALRTTWHQVPAPSLPADSSLFPLSILVQTERGYLVAIGRQMNGAFSQDWHDACAVMMRRLLEVSIIEAFEAKGLATKITGADSNYLQLSDLVDAALNEPGFKLSRNCRKYLPRLRDIGHLSAHGRYYLARREDIENVQQGCRVAIEELLTIAGLL